LRSTCFGLVPIETPAGGDGLTQRTDPRQSPLPRAIAGDVEGALADDMHLDIIPFLKPERFDHGSGQANGKTVSPAGNLHDDDFSGYT